VELGVAEGEEATVSAHDLCQAPGVMPDHKYEWEGGLGPT
jgi:hypothetical protein